MDGMNLGSDRRRKGGREGEKEMILGAGYQIIKALAESERASESAREEERANTHPFCCYYLSTDGMNLGVG